MGSSSRFRKFSDGPSLVPTLRVGMPSSTLRVGILAPAMLDGRGRGASRTAFPRGPWERVLSANLGNVRNREPHPFECGFRNTRAFDTSLGTYFLNCEVLLTDFWSNDRSISRSFRKKIRRGIVETIPRRNGWNPSEVEAARAENQPFSFFLKFVSADLSFLWAFSSGIITLPLRTSSGRALNTVVCASPVQCAGASLV